MELSSNKALPLVSAVKDGISLLKLDKTKIQQVADNKSGTLWGIVILAVPLVVNFLLSMIQTTMFWSIQLKFLLIPTLTLVAGIFAMSLVAQIAFHSKGDHMAFFRVLAHASVAMWASIIPFILSLLGVLDVYSIYNLINLAAGVWMLVVTYFLLQSYYKLNQQNTVITLVVGVVAVSIIQSLLGRILIGAFYKYMY